MIWFLFSIKQQTMRFFSVLGEEMAEHNPMAVCVQFSGGSDSTLTAYRMSREFSQVHLLTFRQNGQLGIENSRKSYALLNDKFPGKFIHTMIDVNDMFVQIYNRRYLRNLLKYRTSSCSSSASPARHASTSILLFIACKMRYRTYATAPTGTASPMQIEIVKREIKKLSMPMAYA